MRAPLESAFAVPQRLSQRLLLLLALGLLAPAAAAEGLIEVAFSPHGEATELVIKAIEAARISIRVSSYSFTSQPIAAALVAAHQRGVDVKVVMDKSQRSQPYSSASFLANMGVPLRIDTRHAIYHNKFLVIDNRHVETGSFNYTSAAEKANAENVILLWNSPLLAQRYSDNWALHWQHALPYAARD